MGDNMYKSFHQPEVMVRTHSHLINPPTTHPLLSTNHASTSSVLRPNQDPHCPPSPTPIGRNNLWELRKYLQRDRSEHKRRARIQRYATTQPHFLSAHSIKRSKKNYEIICDKIVRLHAAQQPDALVEVPTTLFCQSSRRSTTTEELSQCFTTSSMASNDSWSSSAGRS